MKQNITIKDIDRILNEFGMPQDLADLLEGMANRIMSLSDNDILMSEANVIVGREERKVRRGILHSGSYSSGTLRGEDIIRMFDTIGQIVNCDDCKLDAHLAQALSVAAHNHESEDGEYCDTDGCEASSKWRDSRDDMVNDLFDHVQEYHTPEGFYFGSVEGDGADFGVWQIEEGTE